MTSDHPSLSPLLGGGAIAPAARRALLDHARGCAPCRARIAAEEPSLLFTLLALEPVPAAVLERISPAAIRSLARERSRGQGWIAAAAALVLAGVFGAYLWDEAGPRVGSVALAPPATLATPYGSLELLQSPGDAEVVEIQSDGIEIVMIFDEALEI
jgi:hypothetical protein